MAVCTIPENVTTFSWGRDSAVSINITDSLHDAEEYGEITIDLESGTEIRFIAESFRDENGTRLMFSAPVTVYVYQYPSNDFEGTLEEIDSGQTAFLVDGLDSGEYYLRVNHQNQEKGGGSISYYFKVRIA